MPHAVITRERNATLAYTDALRDLGLDIIAMPVTRTEAIDAGLDRVLRERRFDAIACASARAATALVEAWNAARRTAAVALPEVWAVGRATADVLEAAGLQVVLDETVRDGVTLARAMLTRSRRDHRILIPRSAKGKLDLIRILIEGGAIVETVDVYSTVPVATDDLAIRDGMDCLRDGKAAVCAVFAPSQVEALDALIGIAKIDAPFAAIGETTAEALRAAGARRIAVADQPTPEGIASAIAAVYPRER